MNVTFRDHGFVFVVFVVVFPFVGLWSYRRFLARVAVEGEPELIREYRRTTQLPGRGPTRIFVAVTKNKVRMALARRLLVGVYKMLLTGEEFSLERCLGLAKPEPALS